LRVRKEGKGREEERRRRGELVFCKSPREEEERVGDDELRL